MIYCQSGFYCLGWNRGIGRLSRRYGRFVIRFSRFVSGFDRIPTSIGRFIVIFSRLTYKTGYFDKRCTSFVLHSFNC